MKSARMVKQQDRMGRRVTGEKTKSEGELVIDWVYKLFFWGLRTGKHQRVGGLSVDWRQLEHVLELKYLEFFI